MRHTLYSKEFIVRKLSGVPALGLDLSEGAIHYVSLKKAKHGLVLRTHGTVDIPDAVYSRGFIKDTPKLLSILKMIRKKSGTRYARASIPEEQVYVIDMTLPIADKKKVIDKITKRLVEILPAFFDDMLVNYEILSEDKESFHLNVAIAKKTFVDEYLKLLDEAGFSVVSLEFRTAAIAHALIEKKDGEPKLVVSLEHTKLAVFGAASGIVLAGIVSEIDSPRNFHLVKEKVDRAYIEWQRTQPGQQFGTVLLCGPIANEEGLAEYLAVSLKLPVELGNVWTNVNTFDRYIPEIPRGASLGYHAAIGLALADFEK